MNCKQGDLAVVVRSDLTPELAGRIVRCVRLIEPTPEYSFRKIVGGPTWLVSCEGSELPARMLPSKRLVYLKERPVADARLRPIRDNDGEDETLTWASKPEQVTA